MKYYCEYYLSDSLIQKKEEILSKLENGKFQLSKYVIILAEKEEDQLEIIDSMYLIQKYYQKKDLFVVGIADGFEEALSIVKRIAQEVYDATGGADIQAYIKAKQKDFEEGKV